MVRFAVDTFICSIFESDMSSWRSLVLSCPLLDWVTVLSKEIIEETIFCRKYSWKGIFLFCYVTCLKTDCFQSAFHILHAMMQVFSFIIESSLWQVCPSHFLLKKYSVNDSLYINWNICLYFPNTVVRELYIIKHSFNIIPRHSSGIILFDFHLTHFWSSEATWCNRKHSQICSCNRGVECI